MDVQSRAIGPLLIEHQPERVLAVDLDAMSQAAGLGARSMHMVQRGLLSASKVSGFAVTEPVTTSIANPPI